MNTKSTKDSIFEKILKQKEILIEDLQKQLHDTHDCDCSKKDTR